MEAMARANMRVFNIDKAGYHHRKAIARDTHVLVQKKQFTP